MDNHHKHADAIKAAIRAALDEGFKLEVALSYGEGWGVEVEAIDLDLWSGTDWLTVFTENRCYG